MENVITLIFFILLTSYLLRVMFDLIKIPKLLAPIFVGVLFQILFFQELKEAELLISFLSEFGIIMLLFYIGLEVNIKSLEKKYKETLSIAILGFITTFFTSFLLSLFVFDYSLIVSFVIASVLSITAEGVAVLLLKENSLLKSNVGDIVIGAGIIDDIIGIFLLLVLSIIISLNSTNLYLIIPTIIGCIIIILLFYFLKDTSRIVDYVFIRESFAKNSTELLTLSILFLFGFALFTQYINLEFSLGAIIAGLILNISLKNKDKKGIKEEGRVTSIISNITFGFLIYFFLFWIGTQFDITNLSQNILMGILFAIIAVAGKSIAPFITEHKFKESFKATSLIGIGLSSKGGIELVIAAIAKSAGLINDQIFSSIIVMSIILTFIVPILFNFFVNNFKGLKRRRTN